MTPAQYQRFVIMATFVLLAVAVPLGWALAGVGVAQSAALGGVLGIANFMALAWIVERLAAAPVAQASRATNVMMLAKLMGFASIAYIAIAILGASAAGFLAGYSANWIAVVAGGALSARRNAAQERADGTDQRPAGDETNESDGK